MFYLYRFLETKGFHPKVAAELYVGDSLAMIREAGVDDLQENPNVQVATNRFSEACKLTWRELAFYVAATWQP